MSQCTIDGLAKAITKELEEYRQDVTDEIKEAVEDVAKDCRADIEKAAPRRSGAYARGWKAKKAYESRNDIRFEVCNPRHYQLAHLLEHGHAKRNGGRVEGKPHIGPAAARAEKRLMKKAKVAVKG